MFRCPNCKATERNLEINEDGYTCLMCRTDGELEDLEGLITVEVRPATKEEVEKAKTHRENPLDIVDSIVEDLYNKFEDVISNDFDLSKIRVVPKQHHYYGDITVYDIFVDGKYIGGISY